MGTSLAQRHLPAWAESGAMALTGRADGPPLPAPPGVVTGLAELAARYTEHTGIPLDGPALLGERAAHAGLRRAGDVSCGGRTRLLRSADGWVAVSLARPDDLDLLPAWLGPGATEANLATAVYEQRTAELLTRAALLGLPVSALGESAGLAPLVCVALRGKGAPAGRRPVVIDLSSLWAGPLCGQLLGQAGLRVIKVESTRRPDGARFGPIGFYDLLHAGQESVALHLTTATGRLSLAGLIAAADVVIEASRPRALQQLGIDPGHAGPRVWVSITGYGREGEAGRRVAFGDDAAVAGRLVASDAAGPCFCADAVADPATGLYAAVAALDALQDTGRWLLDVRLAGVAAWLAGKDPDPSGQAVWTRPVAPPRARPARGEVAGLGEHTEAVLREFAP